MYTYSLVNNLLKIVYATGEMKSLIAQNFKLKELVGTFPEAPTGGKYWEFPINTQWPSSVGAMAFNGTVRTPDQGSWETGRVYVRQTHGTVSFEFAGMALSEGKEKAFQSFFDAGKEQLALALKDHEIKQWLGGYNGTLALVNGSYGPAKAAVPVEGMLGYKLGNGTYIAAGAEVFRPGNKIVFDPAGTPQYRTVVSVDVSAGTIEVDANVTVTDGMTICYGEQNTCMDYHNSYDGLNDAFYATTYENIANGTVPGWAPQIFTGTTAGTLEPLSSKHINRLIVVPQTRTGCEIDVILSNSYQVQSFMDMFESQILYDPTEFKGGMTVLPWTSPIGGGKVKFVFDPQVPHNVLMGLPTKDLLRFVAKEGQFLAEDGAILKWIPGSTGYIAVWAGLGNLGTKTRNRLALQTDIEEAFDL